MNTDQGQTIAIESAGGVGYITLDRPPVNVLDIPMLHRLEEALSSLAGETAVRMLVIRARGRLFSAGVEVADHTPDKVGEMIPLVDRVCQRLIDFPVPTLAAVQGHALGGGCELVLCCDLAIMSTEAKIGQPEIRLAALAPVAALRLHGLVGYRAAADMLFTGRSLTAEEALEKGLVNSLAAPENLGEAVGEVAAQITSLSRAALRLAKKALHMGASGTTVTNPEMERLYLQDLMATADAQEGVAAFLEKRDPVWEHR